MSLSLSKGYYCVDCEFIGENSRQCAKCGSGSIHLIQRWLDRIPADSRQQLARFSYLVGEAYYRRWPSIAGMMQHEFDGS